MSTITITISCMAIAVSAYVLGRDLWERFLDFAEQRFNEVYGEARTGARNNGVGGDSASERQSSFALTQQHLRSVSDPEQECK